MIRSALGVLALAFAIAHVPFVASSLEDIDSVNFALGVRDFDVAEHRPHPPGYPVYIALGKLGVSIAHTFGDSGPASTIEARVLSMLSLLGALVAIVFLYRVASTWTSARDTEDLLTPPWQRFDARALAATALAAASPLFWYMAVRPMSDVPGLAAALAAQALLLLAWWRQQPDASGDRRMPGDRIAASGGMIVLGALLAGLAIGVRSQNAVLTLPLLVGVLVDRIGRGVAGALLGATIAFAAGALLWTVPLVAASGGPNAYLAALGSQAGEDFSGVEMLYLYPSPRLLALALMRTLVYPWDSMVLGSTVAVLAALGGLVLLLRDRRALVAIALVAAPYLAFHLLFQDTHFIRYALPLVPAVAFLAVRGLEVMGRKAALVGSGALALWAVSTATPVLVAYGSEPSPTVRALAAMEQASRATPPGALAMHQTFRRPVEAEDLSIGPQLPSPPRREWLELVKYWKEGHTAPVWLLADPRRSDLALIDPRSRTDRLDFSWRLASLSELGGLRPYAAHWYRLPPPGWFAEEGWALTPETAGIARLMGRGPALGPITAWVRRRPEAVRILVGGRHLGDTGDPPVRFHLAIDGIERAEWPVTPGFFLREMELAAGTLAGDGLARLTIRSAAEGGRTIPTSIEQFDLQAVDDLVWGYGEGWHEAEFDPGLGVWRWTADRATIRIFAATEPVVVSLRAESTSRYFDEPPVVRMWAGDRLLEETTLPDTGVWAVRVPADALAHSDGRVTIETSRTFVPAERTGVPDRRQLGLRVFDVSVNAALTVPNTSR